MHRLCFLAIASRRPLPSVCMMLTKEKDTVLNKGQYDVAHNCDPFDWVPGGSIDAIAYSMTRLRSCSSAMGP